MMPEKTAIRPFNTAVNLYAHRVMQNLPPVLDALALARKACPSDVSAKDHENNLVSLGAEGQAYRALLGLVSDLPQVRMTGISVFALPLWTNLFNSSAPSLFSDVKEFSVVDREKIIAAYGDLATDRARLRPGYYYQLSERRDTDVVLSPFPCDCCYDFQALDLARATLDLRAPGSLLMLRVGEYDLGKFLEINQAIGLDDWMANAGFTATYLLGIGDVANSDQNYSHLFVLTSLRALRADVSAIRAHFLPRFAAPLNGNLWAYFVYQRTSLPPRGTMGRLFDELFTREKILIPVRKINQEKAAAVEKSLQHVADLYPRLIADFEAQN